MHDVAARTANRRTEIGNVLETMPRAGDTFESGRHEIVSSKYGVGVRRVQDAIRPQDDGEQKWERLQALRACNDARARYPPKVPIAMFDELIVS